jgi:hypothetical protein
MRVLEEALDNESVGHVYVLRLCADPHLYKVGRSALGKVEDRFARLRVGAVLDLVFVGIFNRYREWEREAHKTFRNQRLPQTEYFRLTPSQLEALLSGLESGNLDLGIGKGIINAISVRADSGCIVVEDACEKIVIDRSVADAFCAAVGNFTGKACLAPSNAFRIASQ